MKRKQLPKTPLAATPILGDELIHALSQGVAPMLGPTAMALADRHGVRVQDVIRFQSVRQRCVEARENAGLQLKEAAQRLGVPQYRVRDIEAGLFNSIQPDILRRYLEMLGLSSWYSEWARSNHELASRMDTVGQAPGLRRPLRPPDARVVHFQGQVIAVKARIRLIRSFDEISHQYQGYTLVIAAPNSEITRVGIGPAAREKYQFRIGDVISGKARPVEDPKQEWATLYKASGLKVERRGPPGQDRPPDPEGGIAAELEIYRMNGHRRLSPKTCETSCAQCPWGLTMATEIIVDHWKPWIKRWRTETHCYGPRDCPRYRSGAPRKVPGRKPGMVWIDNDVEREAEW